MNEMVNIVRSGGNFAYTDISGDCMLPHARNRGVMHFMESPCSDLIMIDDDNWPESGAIDRMLSYDVDVVAAPCRHKNEVMKMPIRFFRDRPIKRNDAGLLEVETVGTGLIKISRRAIEQLQQAFPLNWYHDSAFEGKKVPCIFEYIMKDHQWWGEDISFCKKFQSVGGTVWVDLDIKTAHCGKKVFEGSTADWLTQMPDMLSIHDPIPVKNEFSADSKLVHREPGAVVASLSEPIADAGDIKTVFYENGSGAGH